MKKILAKMAIGMFATTLTPVISNTTINQTSNSKRNINVYYQNFAIGSSYSNYYTEIFDITANTGIRSWIDFTNQYHYFGWSGDNPLGNNWYYASIVLQCQRDGVKNSTLQLSIIPRRNGIPLDALTINKSVLTFCIRCSIFIFHNISYIIFISITIKFIK